MGYVLILLGAVLVLLAWRPALERWRPPAGNRPDPDDQVRRAAAELLDRLAVLEGQLAAVQASVAELTAREKEKAVPTAEAGEPEHAAEPPPSFEAVLAEAEREAWRQEVYAAYEAGEDVASIARRLGRGKGEIELILNLRRQG